jgi:hypothetical protein
MFLGLGSPVISLTPPSAMPPRLSSGPCLQWGLKYISGGDPSTARRLNAQLRTGEPQPGQDVETIRRDPRIMDSRNR